MDDGGSDTACTQAVVGQGAIAPEVSVNNPSVAVDEGDTATNSGEFFDPDFDAVTISASIGTISQDPGSSGEWSWSFPTTDGPDESQTVIITALDSDGLFSETSFELTVENVDPVIDDIEVTAIGGACEGPVHVSTTSSSSRSRSFSVSTRSSRSSSDSDSGSDSHSRSDSDSGSRSDSGSDSKSSDGEGGGFGGLVPTTTTHASTDSTDHDGLPDVPGGELGDGAMVSLKARFHDAGTGDTHTAEIDWGDGNVEIVEVSGSGGSGMVTGRPHLHGRWHLHHYGHDHR